MTSGSVICAFIKRFKRTFFRVTIYFLAETSRNEAETRRLGQDRIYLRPHVAYVLTVMGQPRITSAWSRAGIFPAWTCATLPHCVGARRLSHAWTRTPQKPCAIAWLCASRLGGLWSTKEREERIHMDGPVLHDYRLVPSGLRLGWSGIHVSRKHSNARRAIIPRLALSPVWTSSW